MSIQLLAAIAVTILIFAGIIWVACAFIAHDNFVDLSGGD